MKTSIPRFDYKAQYLAIRREVLGAVDRALDSGQLILGPQVEAFEEAMAEFLGHAGQCVGVACGTDALAIALKAIGVGPGDDVLTVSFTAVGTISSIRMAGASPVFCDIDPRTLQIDPADAARRITPRTRAILPVHLFGNSADMPGIQQLAQAKGLKVVEDCAQSCGTVLQGRMTGTWGDVGCFSFYPTKNLGAYGDGGLCFTRDPTLAEAMRQIRFYGQDNSGIAIRDGVNSRLDALHAAILRAKLRYLPAYLQRRREIAGLYRKRLSPACIIPQTTVGTEHSYHLFVVEVDRRDEIKLHLRERGIECGIHYPVPVHFMPAYRSAGAAKGSLPITERAAGRVLSLPCYPELSDDQIERVCTVLNDGIAA